MLPATGSTIIAAMRSPSWAKTDSTRSRSLKGRAMVVSENDRGIPGTGHCDWRGVFQTLKDIGYDGWLTIESFAQPERELAAAAAIWRDLAPSSDELAQRGLAFIKQLAAEVGMTDAKKTAVRKQ